jgi:general secretion pathway protein C
LDNFLQIFNTHSRKIATGVSIVLIVLMSLSVANSVLFVLEAMNPAEILSTNPRLSKRKNNPVFKVSNLELFGSAEVESAPVVVNAPETKLNLELQGVFIAEDGKSSTAIVAEKNKTGELYAIGDKLPGNATLASVFQDHVLLKRGTKMEKLMFSDSAFRSPATGSTPRSNRSTNRGTTTAVEPTKNRSDLERIRDRIRNRTSPSEPRTTTTPRTRESMEQYRQKMQNDPVGTLSELGVTPVSEAESAGYRVGAEAQGVLQQSGLQPGDVILSVNGRPVGVAANDTALMDQVMASSRVRVEVQRGSRRFFLTVPVPK